MGISGYSAHAAAKMVSTDLKRASYVLLLSS